MIGYNHQMEIHPSTAPFVGIFFILPCMLVSLLTKQQHVDERLLIQVFQSSIYPSWLRNFFKAKSSVVIEKMTKQDSRQSETMKATE